MAYECRRIVFFLHFKPITYVMVTHVRDAGTGMRDPGSGIRVEITEARQLGCRLPPERMVFPDPASRIPDPSSRTPGISIAQVARGKV